VQPDGSSAVNQAGLDHYRRSWMHYAPAASSRSSRSTTGTCPRAQDVGGWTNRDTAKRFEDYARIVADALGDRVERWVTVNEPYVAAFVAMPADSTRPVSGPRRL